MILNLMRDKYIRDGRAPIPEKEITSRIMSTIKNKNTKPEIILRKSLFVNKMKGYRLHWGKVPGKPDICYPGRKIAIFVNGCFWHRCPFCNPSIPKSHTDFWISKFKKNVERDNFKIQQLKDKGWKVLVMWECKINNNIQLYIDQVKKIYG